MPQPFVKQVQKALGVLMEAAQDRHFNQELMLTALAKLVKASEKSFRAQRNLPAEDEPCQNQRSESH